MIPEHVPSGPRSLLLKILIVEPDCRLTANNILNEPWLKGTNEVSSKIRSFSTTMPTNSLNYAINTNTGHHL